MNDTQTHTGSAHLGAGMQRGTHPSATHLPYARDRMQLASWQMSRKKCFLHWKQIKKAGRYKDASARANVQSDRWMRSSVNNIPYHNYLLTKPRPAPSIIPFSNPTAKSGAGRSPRQQQPLSNPFPSPSLSIPVLPLSFLYVFTSPSRV